MKILTLKELDAKAALMFATVHALELFATSDGQFFFNKGDASSHAGPKGTIFPFKKGDFNTGQLEATKLPNSKDSIAAIKAATTLEGLEPFAGDERKTVKDAFDKRTAELTALVDLGGEDLVDIVVTQEMLDINPDLVEQGATVGETIQIASEA